MHKLKTIHFIYAVFVFSLLSGCGANIVGPACVSDGSLVSADDAKTALVSTYSSRNEIRATEYFFEVTSTEPVVTVSFFIEVPLYIPTDALTAFPKFFKYCAIMVGGVETYMCEDLANEITITSSASNNTSSIRIDMTEDILFASDVVTSMFNQEEDAEGLTNGLIVGTVRISMAAITDSVFSGSDEITAIGGPILLNLFGLTEGSSITFE